MTLRQRGFIAIWCAWLVIPAVAAFLVLSAHQRHNREAAVQRHNERMGALSAASGQTQPERTPPPGHENDVPVNVDVGAYLDHVAEFSVVDSMWKLDFFIWFNWEGDLPDPGATFKVVDGEILARTLVKRTDLGTHHYVLYQATAQITKTFDLARFPRDEHVLTVAIEDQALQSYALAYRVDPAESDLSTRLLAPGYSVVGHQTIVKPHSYKTPMGVPTLPSTYKATYSQFIFGVSITRPAWGLFFKMFAAMYVSVLLALGGLFVRGAGERLALASTAFFVAVVNGMVVALAIPDTGIATLADEINVLGYLTIGQLILQAILYHRYFADFVERQGFAKIFDRTTFVVVGALALVINLAVVLQASGGSV